VGEPFVLTLDPSLSRREGLLAASDEVMRRISDLVDPRQRPPAAAAAPDAPASEEG